MEALLKGVPYIGETLRQFIFGPAAELRMRRVEQTLTEVAQRLEALGAAPTTVYSEEFVGLLEVSVPKIARAVSEDTRERFRDLLLNAATLPPGSTEWRNAELAEELLSEIDAPGLAILAALGRCPEAIQPAEGPVPNTLLVSRPVPQLFVGDFDFADPGEVQRPLGYDWTVVGEWTQRLREKRLLYFHTVDARGGFTNIYLTPLGQLLIRWTLADTSPAC
jgi:hypothetical protein